MSQNKAYLSVQRSERAQQQTDDQAYRSQNNNNQVNNRDRDRDDYSSAISTVRLSDDQTTVMSDPKPSKLDALSKMLATGFTSTPADYSATDGQAASMIGEQRPIQSSMLRTLGKKMVIDMLGAAQSTDRGVYRNLQTHFANRDNKVRINNKFTIDYIMQMFDVANLRTLKDKFKVKQKVVEDGFTLLEFVDLMKRVIPYDHPSEECDLVHGLCNLFQEIDINGNGFLEWDEFTSFLIEAVDRKQLEGNNNKISVDDIVAENALAIHLLSMEESQPDYLHFNNMLQVARSQIYQDFALSSTFQDKLVRNTPIVTALLYQATDTFITLEAKAKHVKFLSAMSNQAIPGLSNHHEMSIKMTQKIALPVSASNIYILSAAFNEKDKILALCSTESLIYFYRVYGNQKDFRLFKIICSHGITSQVSMWYMEHHDRWFSIGSNQQSKYAKLKPKVQTLNQWHIPRNKMLVNREMACDECTQQWQRARGSTQSAGESQIERPFIDEYDQYGLVKKDSDQRYLVEPFEHMDHRDDIKDVKEIYHPFLAIITASHDGKLRIISIKLRRIIGILHTGHSTGIRQIDYTPYHRASILSVGYESYFNLWEIDNSQSFGKQMQDLPTKFQMVSSPVIAARFLGQSVYAVAIDSTFCVKIWNYKKQELMQSLMQSKLKMQDSITGLLVFSEGKFAAMSKHVTFFDTLNHKMTGENDNNGNQNILRNESDSETEKQVDSSRQQKAEKQAASGQALIKKQIKKRNKVLEIRRIILKEKGLSEIKSAAMHQRNAMINPPIDVVFLDSYQNFLVLTKDNLRVYNGKNGRLKMYLDNIADVNEHTGAVSDMISMTLNSEHRMVYIGDNQGKIRCFNVNTGLLIKKLDLPMGYQRKNGELSHKINKEVCGMSFFEASEDCQMLISGHWNNKIRIWDVLDVEKANHMRSASAQDVFKEDVQCIAVSEHLSLIATGSIYGNIVVWDFELFKVEGVFIGSKMAITAIEFVKDYPLMVSASISGIIQVYAVRGAHRDIKNHTLARFINVSRDVDKFANIPITGMSVELTANPRYVPDAEQKGELGTLIQYYIGKKIQQERKLAGSASSVAVDQQEEDINNLIGPIFRANLDDEIEEYVTLFNQRSAAQAESQTLDPEEGTLKASDHDQYYQRAYPPFANNENPEILNIVISDENGSIKWLDLTKLIRKPKVMSTEAELVDMLDWRKKGLLPVYIQKVKKYQDSKIGFMPSRRMDIQAGSLALSLMDLATREKKPPLLLAQKCVRKKEIALAHKGRINSIRKIGIEPFGFVTSGNDKFVKVWSKNGQKVGEINLIKEGTKLHNWKFGYDWQQKRQEELDRAKKIVKSLNLQTVPEVVNSECQSNNNNKDLQSVDYKKRRSHDVSNPPQQQQRGQQALESLMQKNMGSSDGGDDRSESEANVETLKSYVVESLRKRLDDGTDLLPMRRSSSKSRSMKLRQEAKLKSDVWDVDKFFPIPSKVGKSREEQIKEMNEIVQGRIIDRAYKASKVNMQTMLKKNTRQTRSQAAFRSFQKDEKKSNLKSNNQSGSGPRKIKNKMSLTSVKFFGEESSDPTSNLHTAKTDLSIQQELPRGAPKRIKSTSSQESQPQTEESIYKTEGSSSETGLPMISETGTIPGTGTDYKSRAEMKLEMRLKQINEDPNSRASKLFEKGINKNVQELTGRTASQIERSSQESKSFKAFETRYEKFSHRSTETITSIQESFRQKKETKDKWQGSKHSLVKLATTTETQSQRQGNSWQIAKHQILERQQGLVQEKDRAEAFREANKKTDDHLKSLIEESESRHNQMKVFMEQRKASKQSVIQEFGKELQGKFKIDPTLTVNKSMSNFTPVTTQPSLTTNINLGQPAQFRRPPRVASALKRYNQKTRNDEEEEGTGGGKGTKSQFLNRIDKYINPPGSNGINSAFDINFMMRDSSNAKELSSQGGGGVTTSQRQPPSQGTYVGINAPKRFHYQQTRQRSSNGSGYQSKSLMKSASSQQIARPDSRKSHSGVRQSREMQRHIARQISQKTIIKPEDLIKSEDVVNAVEDQTDGDVTPANSTAFKERLQHRTKHIKSGSGFHHSKRMATFLSQHSYDYSAGGGVERNRSVLNAKKEWNLDL